MSNSSRAGKKRIVFIGKRNVGKSSLVNAFLGKEVCTVDKGKSAAREVLEIPLALPPYGSVVVVDTVPLDEQSDLKKNKINQTMTTFTSADFVVVVLDAREKLSPEDKSVFYQLKKLSIPFLVAVNKIEYGINCELINGLRAMNTTHFEISCKEDVGIDALKSRLTRLLQIET